MEFDEKLKEYAKAGYQVPTRDMIKNAEQIEKIKESAKINTAVLDEVAKHIKPGMTTEEINTIVFGERKGRKSEDYRLLGK